MAPFQVLARGSWRPDEIILKTNSSFHQLPQNWHLQMETFWRQKEKQGHYNGRLVRLENFRTVGAELHLELSGTDYKTLLFSNEFTVNILAGHSEQMLARALGVSAVVKSSDNQIILMQRSALVGEYPNCFDLFGGHIDADLLQDPNAVFSAIERELAEEAALAKSDYDLLCFGLIEAVDHRKPELLFIADCLLSATAIVERAGTAVDRREYQKLLCLANTEHAVQLFVDQNKDTTPSAVGCLEEYIHWTKNKNFQSRKP